MRNLESSEIKLVSAGQLSWLRDGFDVAAGGLCGTVVGMIGGGIYGAMLTPTGQYHCLIQFIGGSVGAVVGTITGLSAGIAMGVFVAGTRECWVLYHRCD